MLPGNGTPCDLKEKNHQCNKAISAAVVDVTVAAEWFPFFACDVAAFCFGFLDCFMEHDDDDADDDDDDDDDAGKLLL